MSAQDNLSSKQFMPMAQVMKLKAHDYDDAPVEGVVGAINYESTNRHAPRGTEYAKLAADIAAKGIKKPVNIHDGTLYNGHHRVEIAHRLGLPGVPYVDKMG